MSTSRNSTRRTRDNRTVRAVPQRRGAEITIPLTARTAAAVLAIAARMSAGIPDARRSVTRAAIQTANGQSATSQMRSGVNNVRTDPQTCPV